MKSRSLILVTMLGGLIAASASAQESATRKRTVVDGGSPTISSKKTSSDNSAQTPDPPTTASEGVQEVDKNAKPSDIPPEALAKRRESVSEEEASVLPYYNNYLSSYRLGPEDVISVTVFGQDRYSKAGIVIPPDGRISYPLVPDGIFVAGKTTQQVQEELTKRLDEYIIDPKISVALEKAMSARYSVLGDVLQPGIRTMTHRLSVYEALAEAGGVLNTGDKSKVFILRRQPDGTLRPLLINIKEIERGRAREMAFLVPGDQVVVPGNRLKKIKQIVDLASVASFARVFTGGVF
jgi:polysaccharide export outer membrane protein